MTVESPAIEWVRIVAERLGDLRDEVVFLGGANGEIEEAEEDLRLYLHDQLAALLADVGFRESLSGHLRGDAASQARLPTLLWRLHGIHSDDEEQALLRTMLDHIIDEQELLRVRQFRLAHEQRRNIDLGSEKIWW